MKLLLPFHVLWDLQHFPQVFQKFSGGKYVLIISSCGPLPCFRLDAKPGTTGFPLCPHHPWHIALLLFLYFFFPPLCMLQVQLLCYKLRFRRNVTFLIFLRLCLMITMAVSGRNFILVKFRLNPWFLPFCLSLLNSRQKLGGFIWYQSIKGGGGV